MFLLDKRVYRLILARFFDTISSGLFMMALPWVMLKMGNNATIVALIAVVCTVSSFILTPLFATLIDRYSRKKIIVTIQFIQSMTAFLVLIISLLWDVPLWVLVIAQIIFWITTDTSWDVNNALTQEVFEKEEYPRIISYQVLIKQTAFLGAGAMGVIVLENWTIQGFAFCAAVCSLLGFTFYSLTPYRRRLREKTEINFLKQISETRYIIKREKKLFILMAFSGLTYPAATYLSQLIPIFLASNSYEGSWFALWNTNYGVGALLCGFVSTMLLRKFSKKKTMVVSVLLFSSILIIMALSMTPTYFVISAGFLGFLNLLCNVTRLNLMNEVVDVNERGRFDGGLKLFTTISQFFGYIIISILTYVNAIDYGFFIISFCIVASGIVVLLYSTSARATLGSAAPLN